MIDFKNDKTSDLLHKYRWRDPRLRVRRVELNALIRNQYVKFGREPPVCSWIFFDGPTPRAQVAAAARELARHKYFLVSAKFGGGGPRDDQVARPGDDAIPKRACANISQRFFTGGAQEFPR